jgi:hypothetical protein
VLALLFEPSRLRRIGRIWLVAAFLAVAIHLLHETSVGLTDGNGHPFGDDALNFWSAARLAFQGHAAMAYDLAAFHGFQLAEVGADLQLYHDSYPPVLMLLTWPVGALPYPVFWAFWLFGGWLLFALCIRQLLPRDWGLYAAVMTSFVPLWLLGETVRNDQARPRIAMVLLAFAPIAAAPIAVASGLAAGGALLLPALRYSARQPV